MIEGIKTKELVQHCDKRGYLMEILRGSDSIKADGNGTFGQYYLSAIYPAVIKGKHMHKLQTDHLCVIRGSAVLHLEDGREGSITFGKKDAIRMGEGNWKLVVVPPGIWHSFENIGTDVCMFINYTTREYDAKQPDEHRGEFDLKDKKMKTDVSAVG
jgi:dTDP-4-dehydrorhamnose 3,5-epimerase